MNVKIYANNLEQAALDQINILAGTSAFEDSKIRIMPDAHTGAGCVIGFTANLGDKVVPNLIGVDIGCGMYAANLGKEDIDPESLDTVVKRNVPSGFNVHARDTCDVKELGLLCIDKIKNIDRQNKSKGTLGGGNHFIELNESQNGDKYLVIHSGSRNIGLQVAQLYQAMADENCSDDVPKDLNYLTGELREAYLHDMTICQQFAWENREEMAKRILVALRISTKDEFQTVHNYLGPDGIIRKGAISAHDGERVLIPFNMRDGSIIGYGKGNEDWNNSAPHGAGRIMSRSKARKDLSVDEFTKQMEGIYSTTVCKDTIDEAPGAYKPAQQIIDALEPTVDIAEHLKPLYNFKAVQ